MLFFFQTWVKPILRIAPMKTEYDLEMCLSHRAQPTKLTEFQSSFPEVDLNHRFNCLTLQGINISHLGEGKSSSKVPWEWDMLIPWSVYFFLEKQKAVFGTSPQEKLPIVEMLRFGLQPCPPRNRPLPWHCWVSQRRWSLRSSFLGEFFWGEKTKYTP